MKTKVEKKKFGLKTDKSRFNTEIYMYIYMYRKHIYIYMQISI